MKQGSRGVKTAYKDLKSKLRDKTPPQTARDVGHLASTTAGHHSAPNSPVFNKRPITDLFPHNQNPRTMLQTSNSLMNNSNYANNNHIGNASPATSPTSSVSSSEMNLLQEIQQHALFKLPTVDRSVSFSNSDGD